MYTAYEENSTLSLIESIWQSEKSDNISNSISVASKIPTSSDSINLDFLGCHKIKRRILSNLLIDFTNINQYNNIAYKLTMKIKLIKI